MTAPTFVKALPKFQPRNLSEYAELAKTKPGEYLELPWPEDHAGSTATQFRNTYHLEARVRTVDGVRPVYIRYNA
jgi:hypothetical protein